MNARNSSLLLYIIAKLNPAAWDAIIPHGPQISVASREYLIAMALKGFSAELGKHAVAEKLAGIQKTLVKFSGERLAAEFDDDNWCGTRVPHIPIPFPGPDPSPWSSLSWAMLNPQPLPPREVPKEIGGYLTMLAQATSLGSVAKELETLGGELLRG